MKAQSYLEAMDFLPASASSVGPTFVRLQQYHRFRSTVDLTNANTPFRKPTIAIYWHGVLLGVGEGASDKSAKTAAVKQALITLDRMAQRGISVSLDGNLVKDETAIRYGLLCRNCHGEF